MNLEDMIMELCIDIHDKKMVHGTLFFLKTFGMDLKLDFYWYNGPYSPELDVLIEAILDGKKMKDNIVNDDEAFLKTKIVLLLISELSKSFGIEKSVIMDIYSSIKYLMIYLKYTLENAAEILVYKGHVIDGKKKALLKKDYLKYLDLPGE